MFAMPNERKASSRVSTAATSLTSSASRTRDSCAISDRPAGRSSTSSPGAIRTRHNRFAWQSCQTDAVSPSIQTGKTMSIRPGPKCPANSSANTSAARNKPVLANTSAAT